MVAPVPPPIVTPLYVQPPPPPRALLALTSIGAGLAAVSWATFALALQLRWIPVQRGVDPIFFTVLPIVLTGLYVWRAIAVYSDKREQAGRLIMLHCTGIFVTLVQLRHDIPGYGVWQATKIGVHVFGVIPAILLANATRWRQTRPG